MNDMVEMSLDNYENEDGSISFPAPAHIVSSP